MQQSTSRYRDIHSPIEILTNLVYLTKHESMDTAKVIVYMEMAEAELQRLYEIARSIASQDESTKPINPELNPDRRS